MRVTLTGLGHRFSGQPWLFTGLDAVLLPGHVYAVTGPSGSGKSTLLALLAGWLDPGAGTVEREDVARVGWVFQNPHGVARRTAGDHVALPLLARGMTRGAATTRAGELMADFGLGDLVGREFAALSGGEAQRLMLARGVASGPDLLLVDEPTAQLDARTAAGVDATLGVLSGAGAIVVVATHDPHTRAACTDHLDLGSAG